MPDTSLIISLIALGVAVGIHLLPGKEWVRKWFHRLWPKTNREDAFRSADLELETVLEQFRNNVPATAEVAAIQELLRTIDTLRM
ncbi:hypothetical protein N7527_004756 [Penicillium freii]|nr:hypothetical protein N7527_004756 [Penicillium freii]